MNNPIHHLRNCLTLCVAFIALSSSLFAVEDNLRKVFSPAKGWYMVDSVRALKDQMVLWRDAGKRSKILINRADFRGVPYIGTLNDYGDCSIEMEFMIPKGSNSGVYLQGRYEIQIIDSYGQKDLSYNSMGGLYHQWRQDYGLGHNGTPPRVNAMKAPGEWQKLEIHFRAPRLDDAGNLKEYPMFTEVLLNGESVLKHVILKGHTRSAPKQGWVAKDKTFIQGDHGPVAIRKFHIQDRDYSNLEFLGLPKNPLRMLLWKLNAPKPDHLAKVNKVLPKQAPFQPKKKRNVLIFSRTEGFYHPCIPLADETLRLLGESTGAYKAVVSQDMEMFKKEVLEKFDAIIFNNTTRLAFKNQTYRQNLLDFVNSGKGIVGIHAASDNFYTWNEGARMIGGQFDGHPWNANGTWSVKVEEPAHALCKCFKHDVFKIKDEIYQIKGPYSRETHSVLLSLDLEDEVTSAMSTGRPDKDNPISWVKSFGKGRVFYCSLGHNFDVYWNPEVIEHYLAGIQFAIGDAPSFKLP